MKGLISHPHLASVASILDGLGLAIERLGATLCADPDVAMNHVETLQGIDLIAQKQRYLAQLLKADSPEDELTRIGLEGLVTEILGISDAKEFKNFEVN